MSLPVLIGFAGVLVAAVATGVLAGRCVRQPRIYFDPLDRRDLGADGRARRAEHGVCQSASARPRSGPSSYPPCCSRRCGWPGAWSRPVAASDAARFGARLVSSALTVVAAVILVHRPAQRARPSANPGRPAARTSSRSPTTRWTRCRSWPWPSRWRARASPRRARRQDPRWRPALIGVASVGLAVLMTVGLRFSLPVKSAVSAAQHAGGGACVVRRDQDPAASGPRARARGYWTRRGLPSRPGPRPRRGLRNRRRSRWPVRDLRGSATAGRRSSARARRPARTR